MNQGDHAERAFDSAFELTGGALCVDFTNTWGDRRRPESDRLHGYDDLLAFAAEAGGIDRGAVAALRRAARRSPAQARAVMAGALRLRDALYRLLAAEARGRRPAADDVEAVNGALAEALPYLRLSRRAGAYVWRWTPGEDPLAAPLRPVARSAADLLTSGDLARVRECDGADCTWLFLDQSRNRSRRWCSMEGCGNRAKARRHYHRHREGPPRP